MIYQLHHQFKDGKTEMCSQRENVEGYSQFAEWLEETEKTHPLPEGAQWMVCNEESEYFWRVPG